jgi:hypothetical protein
VEDSVETNLNKVADDIESEAYDIIAIGRALFS